MKKKRRYKSGRHPIYDKARSRLRNGSQIFNPGGNWGTTFINLNAPKDLIGSIPLWKEDLLPQAEERVKAAKESFKAHKLTQVNQGKREPTEMPEELLDDLHRAEARLDIVREELAELKRLLAVFKDEDRQDSDDKVLAYGPRGTSAMKGGFICEVDGQKVGKNENGMFEIMDSRSRYNGMVVPDYFEKVVKPWLLANIKLLREYQAAIKRGDFTRDHKAVPRAPWPDKSVEVAA